MNVVKLCGLKQCKKPNLKEMQGKKKRRKKKEKKLVEAWYL